MNLLQVAHEHERTTASAPQPLAIIIPAYNEAASLASVVQRVLDVRGNRPWQVTVVDDGSTDATPAVLAEFGSSIRVIRHPANRGYGASLKTGIRDTRAENVLFLDADGQHDPSELPAFVAALERFECVFSFRPKGAGIPLLRRPGKWILHRVCNFLAATRIPDINSGFRAGRRRVFMMMLDLLPDGFSFATTSLLFVMKSRFSFTFLPIQCHGRRGSSSVRIFYDGFKTILLALRLIMLFDPLRALGYPALFLVAVGLAYQLYIIVTVRLSIVGGALLSILSGFVLFLFALLGDQVASLRKEISSHHSLLWEERERRDSGA